MFWFLRVFIAIRQSAHDRHALGVIHYTPSGDLSSRPAAANAGHALDAAYANAG
jgi:hypothetical protein